MVGYLIGALAARGYQITLIAAKGSSSPGRLLTYPDTRHLPRLVRGLARLVFWRLLRRELRCHDLVHSVIRLDYLRPALRTEIPKVLNFQNPISPEEMSDVVARARGRMVMTACGRKMIEQVRDIGIWRTVNNAIPVADYNFGPIPTSPPYLVFLGRITPNKGLHTAIRVAQRTGLDLKIGGNVGSAPGDADYFDRLIRPHLGSDGIHHLGEVDDRGKEVLLRGAVAMLNPIEWEEPFGIVAAESLACGTPVIAFARGELPYILRDGITGYLVGDEDEMVAAVGRIGQIDRAACRRDAESRFDTSEMADRFEEIYEWLLSGTSSPAWEDD